MPTSPIEFEGMSKIPRLFRDMTISEKIHGTNAAVRVVPVADLAHLYPDTTHAYARGDDVGYVIVAQSRNRVITPGKGNDNHGFAGWVAANATDLARVLGPGLHYGEWWGSGIQRGYGLTGGDKRFSLFNPRARNGDLTDVPGLGVVPQLHTGPFDVDDVRAAVADLAAGGSQAAPGFADPEGVIVYHHAADRMFKVTIKGDDVPKSLAGA